MANPVKVIKGAAKMVKLGTRSKMDEKIISSITKKKKPSLKQAQKAKPLANPKSAVRVKPAAKNKPNKPDMAKLQYKKSSSKGRAGDSAYRQNMKDQSKPNYSGYGQGSHGDATLEAQIASAEAQIGRKTKIGIQKAMGIKQLKRRATTPANANTANPFANRIKINSQRNLKKKGK